MNLWIIGKIIDTLFTLKRSILIIFVDMSLFPFKRYEGHEGVVKK